MPLQPAVSVPVPVTLHRAGRARPATAADRVASEAIPDFASRWGIHQRLQTLGASPAHVNWLIRRWLQGRSFDGGSPRAEHYLPAAMQAALPELSVQLAGLAQLASRHDARDGGERLLVQLQDGQTVESVLLPRGGLCVSTQLGCAIGCVFCKTGEGGLLRQLSSTEIVAQVALARRLRAVRKVVFMGMGEPAHNRAAVLEAIDWLGREGGVGHKNLVLSTVGDPRLFDDLEALGPGDVRPALALSLHSTFADRRLALLPRAPRFDPAELLERACAYARSSDYPLQLQWTLIAGINDGDDELDRLVPLLRGRRLVLNMIPLNHVDGFDFQRPSPERCTEIFLGLNRRGVMTRMRQSAAQDVDGGCGQLRARAQSTA